MSLALACGGALAACAQDPAQPVRPMLYQTVGSNALDCCIRSGRIVLNGRQAYNQSISVVGGTERLRLRPGPDHALVEYEYDAKSERLSFEYKDAGQFHLVYQPKGDGKNPPLEFQQNGQQSVTLAVGDAGRQERREATNVWQLLIVDKDLCQKRLVPYLELLRNAWGLADKTAEIEEELLHWSDDAQRLDRQRWNALVRQLADDRFSKRQAADRELRAAGPVVIAFLEQLDYQRLEPEQQARIQAIVAELSRGLIDDTPQQAAAALAATPRVWAALLERPELEARRAALAQLVKLTAHPVHFDPSAPPDVRRKQLDALRSALDKRQSGP